MLKQFLILLSLSVSLPAQAALLTWDLSNILGGTANGVFTIDTITGEYSDINISSASSTYTLAVSSVSSGSQLLAYNEINLGHGFLIEFSEDLTTTALSEVDINSVSYGFCVSSCEINPGIAFLLNGGSDGSVVLSPVPAPASAWLLGSALIGLVFIRRKNSGIKRKN